MMRVELRGGPLDGQALALTAPYTPERLDLVPYHPFPLVVGTEKMPVAAGFPEHSTYALDREASELRPHDEYEGMEQGTAVYVHAA